MVEALNRALTLCLSVVIARGLAPLEFGLVGAASLVVGLASGLGSLLETAAVVRAKGPRWTDADQAVAAAGLRLVLVAATVTLAVPLGNAFLRLVQGAGGGGEGRALLHILLFGLALEGLGALPRVRFQQQMAIRPLFAASVLQSSVHLSMALVALSQGAGARGVCWAAVAGQASSAGLLWWLLHRRERFPAFRRVAPGATSWILREYSRLFAASFLTQLNTRLDNGLVGGFLGPASLAFYSLAWSASRAVTALFGYAFDSVLFPLLARRYGTGQPWGELPIRMALFGQMGAALALGLLVVGADLLVPAVLGNSWRPAVEPLRIMAAALIVLPLGAAAKAALFASGRAGVVARVAALHSLLILVTFSTLVPAFGLVGGAAADALCSVFAFGALFWFSPVREGAQAQSARMATAVVVAFGLAVLLSLGIREGPAPLVLLAERWLVFCAVFAGLGLMLGGFRAVLHLVSSALRGFGTRG
jgi:O-antigen/teichoic acid export membrane protein